MNHHRCDLDFKSIPQPLLSKEKVQVGFLYQFHALKFENERKGQNG